MTVTAQCRNIRLVRSEWPAPPDRKGVNVSTGSVDGRLRVRRFNAATEGAAAVDGIRRKHIVSFQAWIAAAPLCAISVGRGHCQRSSYDLSPTSWTGLIPILVSSFGNVSPAVTRWRSNAE